MTGFAQVTVRRSVGGARACRLSLAQLLFVLAVLSVRTALAVDPERHINELVHRFWDSKSGVPADIRALAQTTDGYLWVGSLRGLYRFDGIQFQEFESMSTARLPSREIRSLFAAPDGTLWIGYHSGGVSVLEKGKLTNYNSVDGFPMGDVWGFARDQQGRTWAASSGGLACFEDGRWQRVGNESSFPGSSAQAVLVDHLGALWVAGTHRIAVLSARASRFELADEPYNGIVRALAESPDGTVWMAETTRAVRPLKRPGQDIRYKGLSRAACENRFPDTWQIEPKCRRPDDLEVRVGSQSLLFDQNGGLWITTLGDGLRRAPYPSRLPKQPIGEFSNALEQFTSKDGLSADILPAMLEDREGNVWVATTNGIDQFHDSAMAPVALGPEAAALSIAPDDEGYVLAVSNNGHVFRFHDAHNVHVTHRDQGMGEVYRDPFGWIWATDQWGGCRFVGTQCATRLEFPGDKSGSWDRTWRLAVDGNRRPWAYVPHVGLFVFEDGRWKQFAGAPPLTTPVTTQYTDPAGRIWFGFGNATLLTVSDAHVRVYSSEDGLTIGAIRAIDSVGNHVWVGGDRGLVVLRGQRFTPVVPSDASAFGSVSGVVEADDGTLWLNEYRGVLRVAASEVSDILEDGSHPTRYDVFDSFDGLPGPTEHVNSPTAIRGTDGRLWFTTTNGAAWVDPRHLYKNTLAPPVVIQSIVADGTTLSSSNKLQLPARTKNLQIAYAGLSFLVPERVRYRYRLKGLDDEWQNAGTRRTANYSMLPAGSYDFQVIASNDAGVWNKVGAELPIRIIPAWYQTWWFYVLCALLASAALAALYRLRVTQIRADTHRLLEARLSERERIARDLHDTLLQSFHGLLLQLQTAHKLLPARPDKAKQTLGTAIDGAFEAATAGRDTVQGLRSSTASGHDLAVAIKTLGEELAGRGTEQQSTELRVDVTGTPQALRPLVRDEIYRIAGESLRNAFRHAGAKRIEVELCYDERRLRLRVRDDGKGIDPQFLRAQGRPGHYGIPGMRERAKLMGASLAVWTAADSGTEVELRVPASRAYARSRVHRWWSVRKHLDLEES
jgi:signal transduction histidine kinase/ligand-binding sensor domain-containing protein